MKSYYKYLESSGVSKPLSAPVRKPVFRSSAVFPVLQHSECSTRISFMGYWLLKREIKEIALLTTLRGQKGEILRRDTFTISSSKAFSIELKNLLKESGWEEENFCGSLELEIFSTQNLVFPYPAFVLSFYREGEFNTAVHTTGRIYNDVEDWKENDETQVPESGFDIYADPDLSSFIALTNGPLAETAPAIFYTVVSESGKRSEGSFKLPDLAPYETIFVHLKEYLPLAEMLDDKPGAIKLRHAFKGFFPRFLAGNFQDSFPAVSITHTYYDCTQAEKDSDYWKRTDSRFHDAGMFIPLFLEGDFYTELIFYPIYSPSLLSVSLFCYDAHGLLVQSLPDYKKIATRKEGFEKIRLKDLAVEHGWAAKKIQSLRLVLNAVEGHRFPTRIKMGLNVGIKNRKAKLPCNICFNAQPGDPQVEAKTRAFRWAPFLNNGSSVVVLSNFSPLKEYDKPAEVEVKFFREADSEIIERRLTLPPFGQLRINAAEDVELKNFFQGRPGWMTAVSSNPYLWAWYFDFHETGSVAGDHCF